MTIIDTLIAVLSGIRVDLLHTNTLTNIMTNLAEK